jgi:branched-chain amino acid aminotransferase
VTEKKFDVLEMLDWVRTGEAALSGTAAVLAGVGTLIYAGNEHRVGTGHVGKVTKELRAKLVAVQQGEAPDPHGWLERV